MGNLLDPSSSVLDFFDGMLRLLFFMLFVLVAFVGGYNLRVACSPKKLTNMNDG